MLILNENRSSVSEEGCEWEDTLKRLFNEIDNLSIFRISVSFIGLRMNLKRLNEDELTLEEF